MPGSIQNKLQQFEVAPPPAVWDNISRRLSEEFVAADVQLSEKLDDAAVAAPAGAWDNIAAELHSEMPVEEKVPKVLPLFVRIAAAAVVIGLLFMGGLYFLKSNGPENNIVKTVPVKPTQPANAVTKQQPKRVDTGSSPLIALADRSIPKYKKIISRPVPKPRVIAVEEEPLIEDEPLVDYTTNPEQAPLYDLQTVSALQPVSISVPALRDKKGNIILDASLITKPDDEYIRVTGPNGKQTKISCKFLSCLGYMNTTLTSNDVDTRAIQCKTQFDEWRKKLLAQPAFIPTANNFFDIFELNDLLQEM